MCSKFFFLLEVKDVRVKQAILLLYILRGVSWRLKARQQTLLPGSPTSGGLTYN